MNYELKISAHVDDFIHLFTRSITNKYDEL